MHPRQFFLDFVEPTVADWMAQPLGARHAIIALCEIDNLAEHFIQHTQPSLTKVAHARDALGAMMHDLAIARDVHDTHKHGLLSRKSATITQGQKPKPGRRDGAFSEGFSAGFQIGEPALVVIADDHAHHYVDDVIQNAVTYWRAEIAQLPL